MYWPRGIDSQRNPKMLYFHIQIREFSLNIVSVLFMQIMQVKCRLKNFYQPCRLKVKCKVHLVCYYPYHTCLCTF